MKNIKDKINIILRSKSKLAFINQLTENSVVLDIGCGNNSGELFKKFKNNTLYGIDISKESGNNVDIFKISNSKNFNNDVQSILNENIDVIICTHVLEHVNNYKELVNIIASSNVNKIYLSFPSIKSIFNPKSRYGTLNFYQDRTHKNLVSYKYICQKLVENGWKINFSSKQYKPILPYLLGIFWQPIFLLTKIEGPLYSTYSFYGFESVIIAEK